MAGAKACPERRRRSGGEMKPTLKDLLADLLADARASRGSNFAQPLKGGLTIHVKVTNDDVVHLEISRVDVAPDQLEWKAVTALLGAPAGTPFVERTPEPKHTPYQHQTKPLRIYLVGEWQLQPEL